MLPASKAGKSGVFVRNVLIFPFFSPPYILQPVTLSPTSSLRFPPATYPPQPPDHIQIFATWPLRDPARLSGSPGDPCSDHVSPLHGNNWARRSIVTLISCCCWEWGTKEPLLFQACFVLMSKIRSWIKNIKDVKGDFRPGGWRSLNTSASPLQEHLQIVTQRR